AQQGNAEAQYWLGMVIPPRNNRTHKWNFAYSGNEEIPHEEVTLYGQPDHGDFEAGRVRCSGSRAMSRARHEQRHVLQVARQVWRHGHIPDEAPQGTGRRKPAAEENVRRRSS